jgi:central kinetochore subunit Mis15/CHL4
MPAISIPTTSSLPATQRIASTNPGVLRILTRLSRKTLIELALDWLDERNLPLGAPFLANLEAVDEYINDFYPPYTSIEDLTDYYNDLKDRKGTKRDVVDRMLEGDWRHGLTLYQLAMADMQYLYDHPTSQKWTALKVVQLHDDDESESTPEREPQEKELPLIPRFHPATFLENMKRAVLPDVKVHYNLDRHPELPIMILRLFILDSPYATSAGLSSPTALDASKTIYVAFPDASPHIFVSLTSTLLPATGAAQQISQDAKSLRKLVLDCIPRAFSRPRQRYALKATSLSAKSLEAMHTMRGGGRTSAAQGAWGDYAGNRRKDVRTDTPLNTALPLRERQEKVKEQKHEVEAEKEEEKGKENATAPVKGLKRLHIDSGSASATQRKRVASARFGTSASIDDGKGIERLEVRIDDPFPSIPNRTESDHFSPDVRVVFSGAHVFAGIRKLVEAGIIDGKAMPGWMTGEEGVSVGVVRSGRITGFMGSGIEEEDEF